MFSYLFSASKKPVAEPVAEAVPEAVQNTLAADGPSPNQSIADNLSLSAFWHSQNEINAMRRGGRNAHIYL